MINTKKDRKNLYVNLSKLDLIKKLEKLLAGGGYILREEDGRFVPPRTAMGYDVPWVYVKSIEGNRCDLAHKVYAELLDHIPSFCRECYKVVVRPRTLEELFDLLELQVQMGVPCKCGIERRETVKGLYGGYFYCRGVEEGKKRYKEVRKLVNEHLSPETTVLLKRYCTEFEIGEYSKGPSNEYPDATWEDKEMELWVEDLIPRVGHPTEQPDHVRAHVMRKWIHYAYQNGDETYKLFTDGSPLFPGYITYHEEE